MNQHAFAVMPFDTKEGIDFNRVYNDLIKPALESVGFEVLRADEEMMAGEIRVDLFQELLLADLVVADLSIDGPNVWYELGVRHALRSRGIIHINGRRDYMPFDIYTDRALRYHLLDGVPDPAFLDEDRKALARFATETMGSWRGRSISPVYNLLPSLEQPDWKRLRVGRAEELWGIFEEWERAIAVAQNKQRAGDVLLYTGEVPTRFLRMEAYRAAGMALMKLGHFEFALDQLTHALEINPDDLQSAYQKGVALDRLRRYTEARIWLETLQKKHPDDAEIDGLLGRIGKDAWAACWRKKGSTCETMQAESLEEIELLRSSADHYSRGFRKDPRSIYTGINALALASLYEHLTGKQYAGSRSNLEGGVCWAIHCALLKTPDDFWANITRAEFELIAGTPENVRELYDVAVNLAVARGDWFALDSARQQLVMLQELGFKSDVVAIALGRIERGLARVGSPWTPRNVFLFSGHRIDEPEREPPRFPSSKESAAKAAITERLERHHAGMEDIGLCGGANGGDLLFAEACLERGMKIELHIPFDIPSFLNQSVHHPLYDWESRFNNVRSHLNTTLLIMSQELIQAPKGTDPFSRNNLWQLFTALAHGPEKVHFITLWNQTDGDGPGGTKHMYDIVKRYSTNRIENIDIRGL